ncbi:MAG: PTS mannose/fructose/sorbose transporter family subunit IID [Gemmatimonadales bacterium]|nr:MAG: PTS mannose/fructose/sorbose transporter family subunit IID [Gemmatimonadales bacterium]
MKGRLFIRLFFVQALWNYRSLLGAGLLWILLPVLRREYGGDAASLEEALARHRRFFNAHPYLAGFAVGALARMEQDRESAELIHRLREVIRGPLGSLGDRFFWAAWLPTTVLLAGAAGLMGLPGWAVVILFLLTYNAVHLSVRWWSLRTGLEQGRGVARGISALNLPRWTERVAACGVVLVGFVFGIVFTRALVGPALGIPPVRAVVLAVGGGALFMVGILRPRARAGRIPAMILLVFVGLFLLGGWLS